VNKKVANIMDVKERDSILSELNDEQRDFIQLHLKRGKKTVFANHMAKSKGMLLPDDATSDEIEILLDDWILENYIDNGFINPETPCECGRPLRYQYIVKNKGTGQVRTFGITHFEEHTGIPANIVQAIKKGFNEIDYEMDELLSKIAANWNLNDVIPGIPEGFTYSKDIKEHLDVKVPLLERQIWRLKRDVINTFEELELERKKELMEDEYQYDYSLFTIDHPGTYQDTLFEDEILHSRDIGKKDFAISEYKDDIMSYLRQNVNSARVICELLIKNKNANRDRYSTGKPKIYVSICEYLEHLVQQDSVELVTKKGKDDRIYTLKEKD
jgi:Protein of unknown function (DUF3895)